jgi:hypothetical protein
VWLPILSAALAHACALAGGHAEQRARVERLAVERAPEESIRLLRVATTYALTERLADALALAERVHALTVARKERGLEAWTLLLLGQIAGRRAPADRDRALTYCHEALALAGRLGMAPLVAHCRAELGLVHAAARDAGPSREQFGIAETMYQKLGMSFWLERMRKEAG